MMRPPFSRPALSAISPPSRDLPSLSPSPCSLPLSSLQFAFDGFGCTLFFIRVASVPGLESLFRPPPVCSGACPPLLTESRGPHAACERLIHALAESPDMCSPENSVKLTQGMFWDDSSVRSLYCDVLHMRMLSSARTESESKRPASRCEGSREATGGEQRPARKEQRKEMKGG